MDCKRCGAPLNQGAVLCQECGARQRRRAGAVRCAKCHKTVSLGLTVCPHCGRNVQPAGPRWGLWIAGFIALVLVGLWVVGELPIARVLQEVHSIRVRISGWVQVLGPVSPPSSASVEPTATSALLALVTETPEPTDPPSSPSPSPEASAHGLEASPLKIEAVTGTEAPEAEPASTLIAHDLQASPLGTATPTTPPTPEPTATPTSTPSPSPTATLPPPTASRTATAAKPAAVGTTTYRVQSGDTLSSIAARFGISWEALAAANGLTSRSVLSIGQELIVPAAGASLPPAATPLPRPTATPLPPTPMPLPQLAAPVLISPGDQDSPSGGNALIVLQWEPVAGMGLDDQYQVIVQWTEQGAPQEWPEGFTTQNEIRVPLWLWGRADQPARKYTWYVRAVRVTTDGQGGRLVVPLSPPSQSRVFYWG